MNVLFTDFDGVINNHQTFLRVKGKYEHRVCDQEWMKLHTCPYNMWNLKFIFENVQELNMVVSSSWAFNISMPEIRKWLESFGLPQEQILDKTPRQMSSHRSEEIGMWLKEHNGEIEQWACVDDHVVFGKDDVASERFHKTSNYDGLTYFDACRIIKLFEPEWKEPVILI